MIQALQPPTTGINAIATSGFRSHLRVGNDNRSLQSYSWNANRTDGVAMPAYEALEAQSIFSKLLDRAERGEKVVITRHGKPVMKLVPVKAEPIAHPNAYAQRIEALRQQAIAWRKAQGQPPISLEEALSWCDEGPRGTL